MLTGHFSSEKHLTEDIRSGGIRKEKAIRSIHQKFHKFVYKGMRKYGLKEEEALDAYTDAVVVLMNHVISGQFEGRSKLSTYLFRIFSNKCIDRLRHNTTHKQSIDWKAEFPQLADESADTIKWLMEKEDLSRVERLMEKLGLRCREILSLSIFWDMAPEEIAQRLGLSSKQSVSSMRYQCLTQLRKLFKKSIESPSNKL
ncbi:MAG: sigma-70 family RNA polymerase sigma factor [Bacteroidota bacterium]